MQHCVGIPLPVSIGKLLHGEYGCTDADEDKRQIEQGEADTDKAHCIFLKPFRLHTIGGIAVIAVPYLLFVIVKKLVDRILIPGHLGLRIRIRHPFSKIRLGMLDMLIRNDKIIAAVPCLSIFRIIYTT